MHMDMHMDRERVVVVVMSFGRSFRLYVATRDEKARHARGRRAHLLFSTFFKRMLKKGRDHWDGVLRVLVKAVR